MSLNCLNIQSMRRNDSDHDLKSRYVHAHEKPNFGLCLGMVERSSSGNLAQRPYEKMRIGAALKVKKATLRIHKSGPIEFESNTPRLVRSCGMRRDWSFEDLRQRVYG